MKLYQKCHGCGRVKFFVRKRKFYSEPLHQDITSQNPICGTCKNFYKKVKQTEKDEQ